MEKIYRIVSYRIVTEGAGLLASMPTSKYR